MRWLVTGGLGFIGFHASRALMARGDEVAIADDMSDAPYPRRYKERNLADLRASGHVGFAQGDVSDRAFVARLFANRAPDVVLHLAGLAGVRPSFAEPARYARVNVEGTACVLEAAHAAGVKRVLFASSSSVYGNATPLPTHEDAAAVVPESPYAATKRSAELVASAMLRGMPEMACVALRFFTVYGPRQRPEMAMTLFARAVLEGRPITVFGDGSMRRDFTHVDDIVRGILAAGERREPGLRAYNLGSGAPITLRELVTAIGAAAGVAPQVVHGAVPLGDVDATFADISRARTELAWTPRVSLRDGLTTLIDWVRTHD